MSELPNFKEGLIFDIQDGLSENNPIIITANTPWLFKISDAINYNKNNKHWGITLYNYNDTSETYNIELASNGSNITDTIIKSYSDLTFCNDSPSKYVKIISWNNGIYAFVNSSLYFWGYEKNKFVITRYTDDATSLENPLGDEIVFYTQCNFRSIPTVSYNNENIYFENTGYTITINNPVTILDWNYNINNSADTLKYYQFSLYNSQGKCVVDTGKIYTNTTNNNGFVCNSLDDKSTYTLVGYCVTQNGIKLDLPDLTIKTHYTTGRIYAHLSIKTDKQKAENIVSAEMINLIGQTTNGEAHYIEGEKIDLKTYDNTIVFTEDYNVLKNNFVIRLWINGVIDEDKVTILTLTNANQSDYIEIYYKDGRFYAIKHSCGLTSLYISDVISQTDAIEGNIYLSVLCCNGRIDIYATSYTENEVITQ